jgi:hypothetical protein
MEPAAEKEQGASSAEKKVRRDDTAHVYTPEELMRKMRKLAAFDGKGSSGN